MRAVARLVLLALAVACASATAFGVLPHSPGQLRELVGGLGVWGPVAFVVLWIVVTPALVSGTLLAAASGLCFGAVAGAPLSLLGATLGGVLAFGVARGWGRAPVDSLAGPRLDRMLSRLERRGFISVLLARMAPGVPATWLNYAAGLSRVRLRHFVAGTTIGGAPRVVAYTALGGTGGDLTSGTGAVALGLLVAATVCAGLVALITHRASAPAATA